MLDMKYLRSHFAEVKERLKFRGEDMSAFEDFEELEKKRRELLGQT